MAEQQTLVKVYQINYLCDNCKSYNMRYTDESLTMITFKYWHRCDRCKYNIALAFKYPRTIYENCE